MSTFVHSITVLFVLLLVGVPICSTTTSGNESSSSGDATNNNGDNGTSTSMEDVGFQVIADDGDGVAFMPPSDFDVTEGWEEATRNVFEEQRELDGGNGGTGAGETSETSSDEDHEVLGRFTETVCPPVKESIANQCDQKKTTKCKRMDMTCIHRVKCTAIVDTTACQVYCETLLHLFHETPGLSEESVFQTFRIAVKDENKNLLMKRVMYKVDEETVLLMTDKIDHKMEKNLHGLILYARVCDAKD